VQAVRPLVSFVVPVRNDVLRLQRCLNSIVRNDYPRDLIEIVVVDNESTDGSAAAARSYGAIVI
jgi:glycosyltransferase involved in cell wall biosynthesis